MSSDTVYLLGTIAAVLVIVLVGGWWLNRRTGERIGEAMRDARDARAREIVLGWGDGIDPPGSRREGINPDDDVTEDCVDCGKEWDEDE